MVLIKRFQRENEDYPIFRESSGLKIEPVSALKNKAIKERKERARVIYGYVGSIRVYSFYLVGLKFSDVVKMILDNREAKAAKAENSEEAMEYQEAQMAA